MAEKNQSYTVSVAKSAKY